MIINMYVDKDIPQGGLPATGTPPHISRMKHLSLPVGRGGRVLLIQGQNRKGDGYMAVRAARTTIKYVTLY